MDPLIEDGALVLFQGDSITDAGRYYNDPLDMGEGYAQLAASRQAPQYWSEDGVHPTPAGHGLIARAWLEAVSTL